MASIRMTREDRIEQVLAAASEGFAARGLYGTATADVAAAAGISHAYLFRLFPTKLDLFVAVVERSNAKVENAMRDAARGASGGPESIGAMGAAYHGLLTGDRDVLKLQLHAKAACGEPRVRDAMRASFARLHAQISADSGADRETVRAFFADGMLLDTMAALEADDLAEGWAEALLRGREAT